MGFPCHGASAFSGAPDRLEIFPDADQIVPPRAFSQLGRKPIDLVRPDMHLKPDPFHFRHGHFKHQLVASAGPKEMPLHHIKYSNV
jgi:hypothetical protein